MRLKHCILAFLIVFAWGFNLIAIETGLENIPPVFLAFSRFFLTSIPMVFFVKKPKIAWSAILSYGLVMFALQFGLLLMGMNAGVTPALAGVLIQAQVFFTALIAWAFFQEKIQFWQLIGGLAAFTGIGLVGIKIEGSISLLGFFLVIGAALAWSCGNALTRMLHHADPLGLVIYGSLIAWPPLLALSYFWEGPEKILNALQHLNILSLATICYLSYVTVLLTFVGWSFLIKRYSLVTIAPFSLFIPVVAMLSSAFFLKESLPYWKIIAASLVILGLVIDLFGKKFFPRKI